MKIANLCLFLSILLIGYQSFSQSSLEHRVSIHGGFGTGLYLASTNQKADVDNNALAGTLRMGIDYHFSSRFALGLSFWRNGFATHKDSNTTVSNGNFGIFAQYLLFKKEFSGLYVIGGLGGTNLNYNNKNKKEEGKTAGACISLGLRYQRFFGNNLGWFAELATAGYQYKKLEATYSNGTKDTNEKWEMGITGGELKFGLFYAFGGN